jgi:predicted ATPase
MTVRTGEGRAVSLPPGATELALQGLPGAQLARLVTGVPPAAVDAIVARAGGNALFAIELANLRAETGRPLPESLRAVVAARIDTLAERERTTLRIAAVIGPRFDPEWLSALDVEPDSLAALAQTGLIHEGAFAHGLIREVAYDTLALAAREHLHAAVARHIERTHDVDRPDSLDLLAHHYGHSADTAKQRVYFRKAGDAARAVFATDTAIRHYRGLLALLDGPQAQAATLDLAEVLEVGGEWTEAQALYTRVAQQADARLAARAEAALGNLLGFTGSYPRAAEELERARERFAALGDHACVAKALERLAHTDFQQCDDARASARAKAHAELARWMAGDHTDNNVYRPT